MPFSLPPSRQSWSYNRRHAPYRSYSLDYLTRSAANSRPTSAAAFARSPDDGLIVTIGTLTDVPAVYPFPFFVRSGGLISYGTDIIDSYRRAAGYVDRILKGEKPADLPVQQPTK